MAAVTSVSFSALAQSFDRKAAATSSPAVRPVSSALDGVRSRSSFLSVYSLALRASNSSSRPVIRCMSGGPADYVPVSDTKLRFLQAYKRPIPSIYNNVLQELLVQHHLMKYKRTFKYDPVFALGFVTVYDQLMDGYPSDEDRDAIFAAYISALKEDPAQYRKDAQKMEEWARTQTSSSLAEFQSREGEVEGTFKDIAERAASGSFSYSRFFAVGLFRLLELTNSSEPSVLEKLCAALNVNKRSVDRDLDVYRNLLSKLVQAKELLKEYVAREKKKREERISEKSSAASEAVKKFVGESVHI